MPSPLAVVSLAALALASGCTFHNTARQWNGRLDRDGQPVFLQTTTTFGVQLLVMLPFAGDTRAEALVDAATAEIARHDNQRVRVVETESANWWYALPPLTWLVTPVMGSITFEFTPSAEELRLAAELERYQEQKRLERIEQDRSHVIPEPRR
ncbi:MAG: hypothetical protein ACK501_21475 [Planctomycetota bacterium]|jgi:hypothetical protein